MDPAAWAPVISAEVGVLEGLSLPDIALREIAEGRITYELALPTALGAPGVSHPRPIAHATRARNVADLYSSHS